MDPAFLNFLKMAAICVAVGWVIPPKWVFIIGGSLCLLAFGAMFVAGLTSHSNDVMVYGVLGMIILACTAGDADGRCFCVVI